LAVKRVEKAYYFFAFFPHFGNGFFLGVFNLAFV